MARSKAQMSHATRDRERAARKHTSEPQPHRPSSMLSPCVTPGCNTLTMGGTCVEHDAPVTVTFPRGRPFVREAVAAAPPRIAALV